MKKTLLIIGVFLSALGRNARAYSNTCSGGVINLAGNWTLSGSDSVTLPPGCLVHGNGYQIDASAGLGFAINGTYANPVILDHLGNSSTDGLYLGTPSWGITWTHFIFDACGVVGRYTAGSVSLTYGQFKNSQDSGGYSFRVYGVTSGTPVFDHMQFDSGQWIAGLIPQHCTNIIQEGIASVYNTYCDGSSRYNFYRLNSGPTYGAMIGNQWYNNAGMAYMYVMMDVAGIYNAHVFSSGYGSSGTFTMDHLLTEEVEDTIGDSGEFYAGPAVGGPGGVPRSPITLQNSIELPTRTGYGWGEMQGGGIDSTLVYIYDHNTWYGGVQNAINPSYGMVDVDENIPTVTHQEILRNNIMWNPNAPGTVPGWFKLYRFSPQTNVPIPDIDQCAPNSINGCTNNDGWNFTATNSSCIECTNQANGYASYFSSTPGLTDLNVDPQFVDYQRNVALWDTKYLGHSVGTTWANSTLYNSTGTIVSVSSSTLYWGIPINFVCIATNTSNSTTQPGVGSNWRSYWEFASLGDLRVGNMAGTTITDPVIGCQTCTEIEGLERWVFAGYRPQNMALHNAATDGTDIGAVPLIVTPSTTSIGIISNIPANMSDILGPLTRLNDSGVSISTKNPWPWADQMQRAWSDRYGNWQTTLPPAPYGGTFVDHWRQPVPSLMPGTVTVVYGTTTITGSGTTFGATFCGPGFSYPCVPNPTPYIDIWYVPKETILSATAANPMKITLASSNISKSFPSIPAWTGTAVLISSVTGTGCSGMNGWQTVSSVTISTTAFLPSIPAGNVTLTIAYNNTGCSYTGSSGIVAMSSSTGRALFYIPSVQSDTKLTLNSQWIQTDSTESALGYDYWSSADVASLSTAGGTSSNNFYDNVVSFYSTYYRTGDGRYLAFARWLADAFWVNPLIDRGTPPLDSTGNGGGSLFPRDMSMTGLYLRAMDQDNVLGGTGLSPMWGGLGQHVNAYLLYNLGYLGPLSPVGDREQFYQINELAMCAAYHPDTSTGGQRQICLSALDILMNGWFAQQRWSDGSWKTLWNTTYVTPAIPQNLVYPAAPPYVTVTNGNANVTCSPGSTCNFQSSWFTYPIYGVVQTNPAKLWISAPLYGGTFPGIGVSSNIVISGATGSGCSGLNGTYTVSAITMDVNGLYYAINYDATSCNYNNFSANIGPLPLNFWTTSNVLDKGATGDSTSYLATYVSGSTVTISPVYQGSNSSTRMWQFSRSWLSYGTQPYMQGILLDALAVVQKAVTGYDVPLSTTVTQWRKDLASFLINKAVNPSSRGLWYGTNFQTCENSKTDFSCNSGNDVSAQRQLTPEIMGGISSAFSIQTSSAALLASNDNLYSAMFAKNSSDPGYDGTYLNGLDNNPAGYFWELDAGKWLGFDWGFGRSYVWPAARLVTFPSGPTTDIIMNGVIKFTGKVTLQ